MKTKELTIRGLILGARPLARAARVRGRDRLVVRVDVAPVSSGTVGLTRIPLKRQKFRNAH